MRFRMPSRNKWRLIASRERRGNVSFDPPREKCTQTWDNINIESGTSRLILIKLRAFLSGFPTFPRFLNKNLVFMVRPWWKKFRSRWEFRSCVISFIKASISSSSASFSLFCSRMFHVFRIFKTLSLEPFFSEVSGAFLFKQKACWKVSGCST